MSPPEEYRDRRAADKEMIEIRLAIASIESRLTALERDLKEERDLREDMVSKDAFDPYRWFILSMAGLVFMTVAGLVLKLIFAGSGLGGLVK